MRCCCASAARVLTLISFALLFSQSLLQVNAQSSVNPFDVARPNSGSEGEPTPTTQTTVPTTESTTGSDPTVTSADVTPTTSTTLSPTDTPTSTTTKATPTTTNPPPSTTTTTQPTKTETSTSTNTSSSSNSTSASTSTSTSTSATTTTTTTSGTTTTALTSTTSPGVTLITPTGTTFIVSNPTSNAPANSDPTSYNWITSDSAAPTDGAASASGSASKGFFDNKGAVGGTFAVVGLVAVGGILVGVIYAKRRAARLQDEEDMTYFEKYTGPNGGASSPTDMSYTGHRDESLNEAPIATHAAADAYPDRAMHYGLPSMEEYNQSQGMGLNFNAGVDYPPGMAYDPNQYNSSQYTQGQYSQYNQNQYAGYDGGYGYAQQQPYYEPERQSPGPSAHPFADPSNSPRVARAPPVQQYSSPSELVYQGEAR